MSKRVVEPWQTAYAVMWQHGCYQTEEACFTPDERAEAIAWYEQYAKDHPRRSVYIWDFADQEMLVHRYVGDPKGEEEPDDFSPWVLGPNFR